MAYTGKKGRQTNALSRLDAQVKKGTKTSWVYKGTEENPKKRKKEDWSSEQVPLTESDLKRIDKERETLKSRI